MSNVNNVTASKPATGGAVRVAPYGTALPTSTSDALDEAFKTVGYLSEDGWNNTNGIETSSVKSYGGDTIFSGETGRTDDFKWKMMEIFNASAAKIAYGDDNVVTDDQGNIKEIHANSAEHQRRSYVIDEILADGRKARTVIPNGTLTALDEITHKSGEPMGYGVTISAKADSKCQRTLESGEKIDDTHVTYYG